MDEKSWIRVSSIVKGFKVAIDLKIAGGSENFL